MSWVITTYDDGTCLAQIVSGNDTFRIVTCDYFYSTYGKSNTTGEVSSRHIAGTPYQSIDMASSTTGALASVPTDLYTSTPKTNTYDDELTSGYWVRPSTGSSAKPTSSASTSVVPAAPIPSSPVSDRQRGGSRSSLSTILPAAFGSILFLGIMGGLLLLLLRRRRARRNEAVSPFQSFSDRRISTTPSLRSDPSTSSFVPEATFIQPVHRSVGVPAAGSIGSGTVTSDEKRLQQAKRVGVVRSGDGPSTPRRVLGRDDGEADYRDEVFRRKMDGWSALARARGSTRADERDDKDPFSDQYGTPSGPLLPSPPSPLRLSLTVATSLPSPRASLHPSASSRPYLAAPLSPHFRSNYSPTTAADELEEQAEDGGVSLMGGAGLRPVGQAPPAYQW